MHAGRLRTLRFTVGSALLALGACTSADKPPARTVEDKKSVDPTRPADSVETINTGPIDAKPEPKPEPEPEPKDAKPEPEPEHANPGPEDGLPPVTKKPPPEHKPVPNPGPQ